jgi:hypothetical protein
MSATSFTLDDLTLDYSQEDYKPQRRDGKPGLTYEFKIANAKIKQHNQGHLAVTLENHALDGDGKVMFKKNIFLALPVSVGENSSPTYAKGMWLNQVRPLFSEIAPYDHQEKDEITGRKIYFKDGRQLDKDEIEPAIIEANKKVGEMAKDCARTWIEHGDDAVLDMFIDRTFFAMLTEDKSGKYVNITKMSSKAPEEGEVCYDRKVALGN